MNANDLYMMTERFRYEVRKSDGNDFENLFTKLMHAKDNSFHQVKPQGKLGDKKNDGFTDDKGEFYQVYAPEDLSSKDANALTKLNEDFTGLVSYWPQHGFTIKKFRYVVNDKYKGVGPTTYAGIQQLKKNNPSIDIGLLTSVDLTDIFRSLTDEDKIDILGPNPELTQEFYDAQVMHDIVEYIMNSKLDPLTAQIPNYVDFQKKLDYNKLNDHIKELLKNALIRICDVDDYFNLNIDFQKDELRNRMSGFYQNACADITDSDNQPDEVFISLYENLCPKTASTSAKNAILVLMAYYFQTCDIFKVPPEV